MIGYKEYSDAVKEHAKFYLKAYSDEEINKYFESDEAKNYLVDRYRADVKRVKDGEISEDELKGSCVWSAGYCLQLMFE